MPAPNITTTNLPPDSIGGYNSSPQANTGVQGVNEVQVAFDPLGRSKAFSVGMGSVVLLRLYTSEISTSLHDVKYKVEMVNGCGSGDIFSSLVYCGCPVGLSQDKTIAAIFIPGSYRIVWDGLQNTDGTPVPDIDDRGVVTAHTLSQQQPIDFAAFSAAFNCGCST